MARVVVTSAGFWGDVLPYVPVAAELGRRGHTVTYAAPPAHHGLLAGGPFTLADSGSTFSPADLLADPVQLRLLATRGDVLHGRDVARYWAHRYLVEEFDGVVDHLGTLLDRADLLVTHPTIGVVAGAAADLRGVPWVTGHLFPMMLPSDERDPAALRLPPAPGRAGRAVRRAGWALAEAATAHAGCDEELNALRARHGLAPVRANLLHAGVSPLRTLVQVSPRWFPPPADWPAGWRTTGFTSWDGAAGAGVGADVESWLDAGPPPVAVTLGSAAAAAGGELLADVGAALDDLGHRGVFLVAHDANVRALAGRPGVFAFAPLGPVLARCRALVQSGSHGTNVAALTAGVPTVTVPLLFDQVWAGRRAEELGVGRLVRRPRRGRPAARRRRLLRALAAVLDDDAYAARARALASALAAEDGVGAMCDEIEDVLRGPSSSLPVARRGPRSG